MEQKMMFLKLNQGHRLEVQEYNAVMVVHWLRPRRDDGVLLVNLKSVSLV